MFISIFI